MVQSSSNIPWIKQVGLREYGAVHALSLRGRLKDIE